MRITGLRTYKFSVPTGQRTRDASTGEFLASTTKPWLFLKVETDAGIVGWGEGSGEWLVPSVEATLRDWTELLVDRDPLGVVSLCADIVDRVPWRGGPVFGTAIAAINLALYDIAGKAWAVPVHTILGGKRRDRVRVYTNGSLFETPEIAVAEARRAAEHGYAGIKGNPLEDRSWPMDTNAVEHAARCVAAVRDAVGNSFDILLDAHASPTPELAIALAEAVAGSRPLLLEDPVRTGSVEAVLGVSRRSPVPVAVGNMIFTLHDFKALIDRRACAFLQPDVGHCFGISHLMEIASAAAAEQMLMAPHHGGGPIYYAASLQVDAAIPNFLIQETVGLERYEQFVEHDWVVRDGHVALTAAPGLGLEVKERDIAKMPYERIAYRQYRHGDGSWKGW